MTKRKRHHVEESNNNNNDTNKKFKVEERRISMDCSFEVRKEEFVLTREVAEHTIVCDITGNKWRIGAPIGRGAFGEIFLASDDISHPVNTKNAQYVTKVEPHSNGPLFVEIHCLMNVNRKSADESLENGETSLVEDVGIPRYIASGSHFFDESRYRFLIMPRYKTDLHSIIKSGRLSHKHFLIVASQIIDVLMHLHNRNYVHSDIKAENIMLGSCDITESLSPSGRSRRAANALTYAFNDFARSSTTPESNGSDVSDDDEDFQLSPKKRKAKKAAKRSKKKSKGKNAPKSPSKSNKDDSFETSDDRVYIIDYGLATKFVNSNGEHKPFCCDERRAHDGTLEFTSRDAHFGAHSRRSDLECLGYNLIYWSQGFLPWKDEKLKEQPEIVHRLKEVFMTDVKEILKILYGREVPKYLGEFMLYVKGLEFDEEPDYGYLKGLFEKEFTKLGFKKSEMKLNISEMKSERVANEMTEPDLLISTITDQKTARKLGFLIATDAVDGIDLQTKSNESLHMNASSKFSPKNLRSKEKTKMAKGGKRQKRQPKMTDKEIVIEKMAQGKKLSIAEIATLDPEKIARDRADREYEKFEEKNQNATPQRYAGNPTYAIIEIENKLKSRASAVFNANAVNVEVEKKSIVDSNMNPPSIVTTPVKNREAMKNVIKPKTKLRSPKRGKKRRGGFKKTPPKVEEPEEIPTEDPIEEEVVEQVPIEVPNKRRRGRPAKKTSKSTKTVVKAPTPQESEDVSSEEIVEIVKKKRGRQPKQASVKPQQQQQQDVVEPPDTEEEEASVYYDIPGEGSNDGIDIKDISEDENQPKIFATKRGRRNILDEDSNSASVVSAATSYEPRRGNKRGRYYKDEDFDISQEEDDESVISEASLATKSSDSLPLKRKKTKAPTKSRSTSRSATFIANDEESDEEPNISSDEEEESYADNDSEYQIQDSEEESNADQGVELDDDEDEEEEEDEDDEEEAEDEPESGESEMADDSNDSNDSIDIKYSPIKTRNARRTFHTKQVRGRRISELSEETRNFRLVSTQG